MEELRRGDLLADVQWKAFELDLEPAEQQAAVAPSDYQPALCEFFRCQTDAARRGMPEDHANHQVTTTMTQPLRDNSPSRWHWMRSQTRRSFRKVSQEPPPARHRPAPAVPPAAPKSDAGAGAEPGGAGAEREPEPAPGWSRRSGRYLSNCREPDAVAEHEHETDIEGQARESVPSSQV